MASLFVRIREMVSAHAHHSLDEAENPHVMAQQVLRDLTQDIHHAQRGLVAALGAEKALARQREQWLSDAADWERKAEKLLLGGNEPLAHSALEKAVQARARAQEQERPLERARKSVTRMKAQAERLKSEFDTARQHAAQISANQAAALAMGAASEATDHYSKAMDRSLRLDRLSRKAASFECEVEASSELLDEQDQLEREVRKADQVASVAEAMAALKARVAAHAAGGA